MLLFVCSVIAFPIKRAYAEVELGLFPDTLDKLFIDGQLHTFFRHDSNPYFGMSYSQMWCMGT